MTPKRCSRGVCQRGSAFPALPGNTGTSKQTIVRLVAKLSLNFTEKRWAQLDFVLIGAEIALMWSQPIQEQRTL